MRKVGRAIYTVFAWLFVVGVLVQVFLAGLVVVARRASWENHIGLGHLLGLPLVIMLIFMYLGGMPRRLKWLTWGLFAVYFIQADIVIFLRDSVPYLSAIHPVLALIDFALGWTLARRAVGLLSRESQALRADPPAPAHAESH